MFLQKFTKFLKVALEQCFIQNISKGHFRAIFYNPFLFSLPDLFPTILENEIWRTDLKQ